MQAASRMADGPVAVARLLLGLRARPAARRAASAFGDSLLSWRFLRVGADATTAVLVWALVRDLRPRWALPAWLAAAVTTAQPTSANPTAPALAFALAAVLCATKGRAAWAGGFAALAAFWRPDVGVIAALAAAAVFVAGAWRAGAPPRAARWTAPGGAVARGGQSAGGAAGRGGHGPGRRGGAARGRAARRRVRAGRVGRR